MPRYDDWIEETDPVRDLKTHRILVTKFNKVHIEQKGPHGYWYVHLDKGQLDKRLKDTAFTTYEKAKQAVQTFYINKLKEAVKEEIK